MLVLFSKVMYIGINGIKPILSAVYTKFVLSPLLLGAALLRLSFISLLGY